MSAAATSGAIHSTDFESQVITGEAVALDLRPTGYVLAAAGAMIDWLVYVGLGGIALSFAFALILSGPLGEDDATVSIVITVGLVVVFIVIPIAVELLSRGRSLGKLAVGARIVRDDGGPIGFRHAFIRGLLAVFELYILLGSLAAIVGLLNSKSKRLGDLLAGTHSQYQRVSREVRPVFGVPAELTDWARTADVGRIPDQLARRLSQFLRQASAQSPSSRDQLSRSLAAEVTPWVSPVPAANSELFIAAVVALRRDRESHALELENQRLALLGSALDELPHEFPRR